MELVGDDVAALMDELEKCAGKFKILKAARGCANLAWR